MRIALLMGGDSTEREVSFMSAAEMKKALDAAKYEVIPVELQPGDQRAWVQRLMDINPDFALLALHGGLGENGAVQGLLDCLNIPYAGSKVLGSALCLDKVMSKTLLRAEKIPVAEDVVLPKGAALQDYLDKIYRLGWQPSAVRQASPLVVKPNQGGSSVGVYIVHDENALKEAVSAIAVFKDDVLIERFIEGKEITCAVIETANGPEVLPIVDIEAAGAFYDYEAKYFSRETRIEHTSLPAFMTDMIKSIASRSFTALCCKGYARVDMIVCEEQVYVLEVNSLPGLTSHSLVPKAASLAGISFGALLDRLIVFETERNK